MEKAVPHGEKRRSKPTKNLYKMKYILLVVFVALIL